jgi:23S rRNA pseudouridine1911/1915/1917 synthase
MPENREFEQEIEIAVDEQGKRLDAYLAENSDLSRSFAEKLVNGEVKAKKYKVKKGDYIYICVPREEVPNLVPRKMDIDIVYDCDNYAVINKEAGLTVHPAPGHYDDTLVNAILAEFDISDENDLRPGIVHRLDKDTSGLLLVAKNRTAREKLSTLFAERCIDKTYLAICYGNPKEDHFFVEEPIGRHQKDRKKMSVRPDGRAAKSEITVLKRLKGSFLAQIKIYTGRTHQIRVHMSHMGFPLAGDDVYGTKLSMKIPIKRQALHSWKLSFVDPFSGDLVNYEAPVPLDIEELIKRLK